MRPIHRVTRDNLPRVCDALTRRDRKLGGIVSSWGYPPLWNRKGGFATLVLMILEQQVSLDSARAVFRRLDESSGGVTPENVMRMGVDGLRRAGLTRQKAGYCHTLATRVVGGEVDFRRIAGADEGRARELLRNIKGVGDWTANVYLLFVLRRPDIWPVRDVALMRSIAEVYGLAETPRDEACLARAERWRPWRSVAARMLWHAYLCRRGRTVAP